MAKNKRLVNQYKAMYQQINQITPQVYAGIALALHRKHGWGYNRINDLFAESQIIWQECADSEVDMIRCAKKNQELRYCEVIGNVFYNSELLKGE